MGAGGLSSDMQRNRVDGQGELLYQLTVLERPKRWRRGRPSRLVQAPVLFRAAGTKSEVYPIDEGYYVESKQER